MSKNEKDCLYGIDSTTDWEKLSKHISKYKECFVMNHDGERDGSISAYYDRSVRAWCVQRRNEDGYQVGEASYDAVRRSSLPLVLQRMYEMDTTDN